MANDLSAKPWTLDTASATPVWKAEVKIENIEFIPNLATDAAVLQDQNGKNVADFQAVTLQPMYTNKIGWVNGLILASITAGAKVKVYIL